MDLREKKKKKKKITTTKSGQRDKEKFEDTATNQCHEDINRFAWQKNEGRSRPLQGQQRVREQKSQESLSAQSNSPTTYKLYQTQQDP